MSTGILHFRVDDRMLHGIVATDWVPAFNANRAMVIDGPASTNDLVRSGLKMACILLNIPSKKVLNDSSKCDKLWIRKGGKQCGRFFE